MTFAPPHRRIALLIFAATWLVYATTAGGTMGTTDAVTMFEVARSIVDRGSLDVPQTLAEETWRGADGRYYAPFGIGQSLYDIPFLLAGRLVVRRTGLELGEPDTVPKALVAVASTLSAAVAAAFGFLLAWRLSSRQTASLIAAFVLAFGTLLWPYARFGFNAALTTAALAVGVYGIAAGAADGSRRLLAAGGAALGLALLTRHEMTLAALASLAWLGWELGRDRGRIGKFVAAALPIAAAVLVSLTLNAVRFGGPLRSGHEPAFAFEGFAAFLISPSGALPLYAPAAICGIGLVPLARRNAIARLFLAVAVVMFVFYGSLEDWLGTRSYGPRYLVPLLPLLVAPLAVWFDAARRRNAPGLRAGLIVFCVLSALVQFPAAAVDFSRAGIAAGQPPQTIRRHDWRWSPLWLTANAMTNATASTVEAFVSGRRVAADRVAGGGSLAARVPFGLDFWWVYLFQLGVLPRAVAIAAALIPLAGAAGLAASAWRQAAAADQPRVVP